MEPQPSSQHVQAGENNAYDNLRPLESIMPLLRQMTGVELPFDDVAEQAMVCLDKIGNLRHARYAVEVSVEDGFAELPPNCEKIDAVLYADLLTNPSFLGLSQINGVTYNPGDAGFLTTPANPIAGGLIGRVAVTPDQTSGSPRYQVPTGRAINLEQYGERFVDYTFRDGGLYVGRQASGQERAAAGSQLGVSTAPSGDTAPQTLRVFYRGLVSDERGYPLITPEEALACAYFTLGVETSKKFFAKEAGGDQLQLAQQLSNQHINQARVAPLGDGNELDRVLDERSRSHRHHFGDSFRLG